MIDRQAPWQGHLQAHVPDLAWLSPLRGEGWQLAGQLNGAMRLDGSAGRPEFSGEWRGEGKRGGEAKQCATARMSHGGAFQVRWKSVLNIHWKD